MGLIHHHVSPPNLGNIFCDFFPTTEQAKSKMWDRCCNTKHTDGLARALLRQDSLKGGEGVFFLACPKKRETFSSVVVKGGFGTQRLKHRRE